jgi:hypothetical protein
MTVSFAAAALVAAAPAAAQQPAPAAPTPAQRAPLPSALCSAPERADPTLALPFETETAVVSAPVPTIAPTWGYRVALLGGAVFSSGSERAVAPGSLGQACLWTKGTAGWTADPNLFQLERVPTGAFVFSDIQRAGRFALTAVNTGGKGSSIRVLSTEGGRISEAASLILPPDADLVSFGTAFAGDGETVAVGSADTRFNLKELSLSRERDPRVFLWSRVGTAWRLDGFVRTPPAANGSPTDAMWFGVSLAVSGDTLAIGSPATLMPRPSEVLPRSGVPMVHVFRRTGERWIPEASIPGLAVTPALCFGLDVALDGDLLAVRAADPERLESPASVWLYRRTGGAWGAPQELLPGKGILRGRGYGLGLAVSGGRVLVGDGTARGSDEPGGAAPGMVLVFEERDGKFENTRRLMPRAPSSSRSFGNDLSAEWPMVAVGRTKNESLGLEPGGAYLFDLSGK